MSPASDSLPLRWDTARPPDQPPVAIPPARLAPLRGFEAEAVRERHDRLLLVESEYRQPFGTFSGTLPGVGALTAGLGVMEHHRARW
jgi:hypothetical protein